MIKKPVRKVKLVVKAEGFSFNIESNEISC
jgi:hypothetical protein